MNTQVEEETYNPWSVVNLVFRHLASEGLHPVLGETGDPGPPAAALLRALGITPASEGNRQVSARTATSSPGSARPSRRETRLSQVESTRRPKARCDPEHKDFHAVGTRPKEGCR